ncbi:MAG TPA: AEC family transporter [Methylovirgula sp.]
MLSTLSVVLPIFAVIFAGWLARRRELLGPAATSELNRYVVYLALPALLFDVIAHAGGREIWRPGFIAAFGLSALLCFALTVAIRLRQGSPLADAAVDGLNGAYANTGYMGFPLALAAFGAGSQAAVLIATILTVCFVFALAIVLIEIGLQKEPNRLKLVLRVAGTLARNPLIFSPALAAIIRLAGFGVPHPVEAFVKLLGESAAPCALVGLGLFLAEKRAANESRSGVTAALTAVKLLLQPLLTWVLAAFVFHLAAFETHAAVLIAALPTGTGSFMLAEFYQREATTTSRVILISTLLSVLTLSLYLAAVR